MEEEGKIIEVPSKPGKNDRHYENSGRFAPKDGVGSETTENGHEFDHIDLSKIINDPAKADIFKMDIDTSLKPEDLVENPQEETSQVENPQYDGVKQL